MNMNAGFSLFLRDFECYYGVLEVFECHWTGDIGMTVAFCCKVFKTKFWAQNRELASTRTANGIIPWSNTACWEACEGANFGRKMQMGIEWVIKPPACYRRNPLAMNSITMLVDSVLRVVWFFDTQERHNALLHKTWNFWWFDAMLIF